MWKNTNQSIFQPFYKSNLTARVICKTKYLIHNDRFEVIDLISSSRITKNTSMFKAIHYMVIYNCTSLCILLTEHMKIYLNTDVLEQRNMLLYIILQHICYIMIYI